MHPYIFRGYWADVGTIEAFYDANIQLTRRGAPFNFFHPRRPIYTHPRFLPGTRTLRLPHRRVDRRRRAAISISCEIGESVVGIRTHVSAAARDHAGRCCSARTSTRKRRGPSGVPLGIGRDVVLDRVIVDKNARIGDGVRLVNDAGVEHADGDGYYIRNGIIIVPKGATVRTGTG